MTTGRRAAWPNSTPALVTHRPWDASSGSSDEQLAAFAGRCAQDLRRARQEGHTLRFTVIHGATRTAIDLCSHGYPPDLGA